VPPPDAVPLDQFWDFAEKYGICSDELVTRMDGGPEPSLSRGRSASGGSDAIDPGVPDHRDPVMTSDTAG